MTSKGHHKKHATLTRPQLGSFGRTEFAVLGTTCDKVLNFTNHLRKLFPSLNIAYADEDHGTAGENMAGRCITWQKKEDRILVDSQTPDNVFTRRMALGNADLVVINGNHFEARMQVVICNPEKEASLHRRAGQLTNVIALILPDGIESVPAYISAIVPASIEVPVIRENDTVALQDLIHAKLLIPAPLKALVMAGGQSTRMGVDKAQIEYYDEPQVNHLHRLLHQQQIATWISCRNDQQEFYGSQGFNTITDRILDCGPLGGIISAFMQYPDSAWMVIACDIPLINEEIIKKLVHSRDTGAVATAYRGTMDGLPEPLISIWEPRSYPIALQFISQGYACPRKVLIHSSTTLIDANEPFRLTNVNTPQDLEAIKSQLE